MLGTMASTGETRMKETGPVLRVLPAWRIERNHKTKHDLISMLKKCLCIGTQRREQVSERR